MELSVHHSIGELAASDWLSWFGDDYPFISHAFLLGLEQTGCTGANQGWQPSHLVLREANKVIAAVPAFLKTHSYGEYVFDWAWADAWERSGKRYYPKLVTAAPFTPASGPRVFLDPETPDALEKLVSAVGLWCRERELSSWHLLFCAEPVSDRLSDLGLHQRLTTQFHWYNHDYSSFDDFLATCSSRKRKNLRKERARVADQGLSIRTLSGREATAEDWRVFHRCYQHTYAKRSGHGGYLTREFFTDICPTLDSTVLVLADDDQGPVAGALYFQSSDTLYGRYWGCLREYEHLHFEACYYRGIEYCIERGLRRFDPGAQGEHKIQRGFEPTLTYSNHWVAAEEFNQALSAFCIREGEHVREYCEAARDLLPFKATE
ncbi:conserved hypothetical protein [Luminiphilus syltensis NOR5-1B]|uniref:N-acetyltransferase n=1 Tax=Luminiphilus syltensis NOR5-1B TaxID=565045 RepID=B8KUB1_9GAMM|nr:GNAT family N-acetyltransferase [Luminiphilus syltensis]EED36106.1 conserved hypothetical protein [Luminiphilus syltensis NOR5-1B]